MLKFNDAPCSCVLVIRVIYCQYFIVEALSYLIMIIEFGYFSIFASVSVGSKNRNMLYACNFWKEKLKYF